jgi:hypothetical protein
MAAPRKKPLREYIVGPVFNEAAAAALKGLPLEARRAAMDAEEKKALADLRAAITGIVARHGGEMKIDGQGYGVAGHPQENCAFLLIKAPAAAASEIRRILPASAFIAPNGIVRAA